MPLFDRAEPVLISLSKESLTKEDAVEILTNVFGLLNCLANTEEDQKIMETNRKVEQKP